MNDRKIVQSKLKVPDEKSKGNHLRNGCGSETGKNEKKQTDAKYQNQERMYEKSDMKYWWKHIERNLDMSTVWVTVRQIRLIGNGRNRKLSSESLKLKLSKEKLKSCNLPSLRNQRESPVKRLWERNREERKETYRKPSTRTSNEDMRDQVQVKRENVKA